MVAGSNPDDPIYSGAAYTGVVRVYTQDSYCTGALFGPSRVYVLTAAHCVTDASGNPKSLAGAYVGIDGATSIGVADTISAIYVAPGYVGSANDYANDIAVVRLQDLAPPDAATYSLYTNTDEIGKDVTLVGHGIGGTGDGGPEAGYEQSAELRGRRKGNNTYDELASTLTGSADNTHIVWDFDNGLAAQNSLFSSLGDGLNEVSIAGGDSGGPSFYNGQIIGVHSYTTCFVNAPDYNSCISPPDIHPTTDGPHDTFGELGADTRVSLYANNFLASFATSAPEPGTWFLMGAGLLAVIGKARRFQA